MKKDLKHLLKKPSVRTVVQSLAERAEGLSVLDSKGESLFGMTPHPSTERFSIQVRGDHVGWVVASEGDSLAALLTHLLEEDLQKASLGKETLNSFKELNLFYTLPKAFRQCHDFKEVAELTLKEVCHQLKSTQASIMTLDQESGCLRVVASRGKYSKKGIFLKPGEGIAGRVWQTGEAELITHVQQDRRFIQNRYGTHSLICAPISVEGKVVAVLNVSSTEENDFTAQDLKLASALTVQAGGAIENSLLQEKKIEQDRVKRRLERYVCPQVVQSIMEAPAQDPLETRRGVISVIFADIRGFTKMCESLPAEKMVNYLNAYFGHMVEIVFRRQGTLDKFVGDMLLAFFNAPASMDQHELKAVETAVDMQRALQTFPDPWIREHFKVGIGISTGPAVIGNVGSEEHCDYTVIGDTVNMGARLQQQALGGEILVSQSVYAATKEHFNYVRKGAVAVKNRQEPIDMYSLQYL